MKLSTRGRYGVRLMLDLALHSGGGPVSLKDIAARQEISERYLSNLIGLLRIWGLSIGSTVPGAGTHWQSRPGISTSKTSCSCWKAGMCLVECTKKPRLCQRSGDCLMRDIWSEVAEKTQEALESFTLEALIQRQMLKQTVASCDI